MTLNRQCASAILSQYQNQLRGQVLEVGVGGYPFSSSTRTTSLDIDEAFGPTVVGDAHRLPFRTESFDSVVASQVLEHLHTPAWAVGELARVLRPGGLLVAALPFLFPLHQTPHDYSRLTRWGLEHLFADQPLDAEIRAYGGRLAAVADLLTMPMPSSTYLRRGVRKVRKTVRPVDPQAVTRLGRWLVARDAGEFPMGYVVVARRTATPAAAGSDGNRT